VNAIVSLRLSLCVTVYQSDCECEVNDVSVRVCDLECLRMRVRL
jgi:hypothetical protein